MTSPATLSDYGQVYRQIVSVTYSDVRASLYRLQVLLAEVGPVGASGLADLTARRVRYVRDFVNALGMPSLNALRPPTLSQEVFTALIATLDEIDGQVASDPTTACDLSIQVIELIGREVAWLAHV